MAMTPEEKREYRRRYYQQNRDKWKSYQGEAKREYDRERLRALSADPSYREAMREKSRRWREANLERARELQRKHREANGPADVVRQRANYLQNREERLAYRMFRAHGLWPDGWAAMWDAQGGKCYLCGEAMDRDRAFMDHDHRCCPRLHSCSACRRGLAHPSCNSAIGYAADDPDRLRRMADALEAAQLTVTRRLAAASKQLTFDTELLAN